MCKKKTSSTHLWYVVKLFRMTGIEIPNSPNSSYINTFLHSIDICIKLRTKAVFMKACLIIYEIVES